MGKHLDKFNNALIIFIFVFLIFFSERGIAPGATKTYQWKVPDRSGPSATDPNCIVYAYYSHINKEMDTNSGLIGPMVVCHPGILGENGRRQDVDREIALLFTVLDENKSWYLDDNIQEFCGTPSAVDKADGVFEESNLMHGKLKDLCL